MNRYKWTLTVELSIDPSWVADGLDVSERTDEIGEAILGYLLPYAHGQECSAKVKVTKAPKPETIRKEQGYEN